MYYVSQKGQPAQVLVPDVVLRRRGIELGSREKDWSVSGYTAGLIVKQWTSTACSGMEDVAAVSKVKLPELIPYERENDEYEESVRP